ncbi:MAG: hypothetical protein H6Q68_712 [Firmicutes bacterium]|nr:hypothetical protein [Bacillota bacterium]
MNYDWKIIEPFFVSLHKTSFAGDLVVFVSNVHEDVIQKMQEYGAITIAFSQTGLENIISPNDYRFYLYDQYLMNSQNKYRFVMLTDIRDVVFQDTPFLSFLPQDSISVAVESQTIKIKEQIHNSRWMLTKFGPYIYSLISQNNILCCGTTIGPVRLIREYIKKMIYCIFYEGYYQDVDQAVHNVLLYTGEVAPVQCFDNNSGLFLTVGISQECSIDSNKKILTLDGKISAVIHQYDRHKNLVDLVDSMYREKV